MKDQLQNVISQFQEKFLSFQIDDMEVQANNLLEAGITIKDFLNAIMPCMDEIGEKYETGEYFLPQLIVAGEMFKTVSSRIKQSTDNEKPDRVLGEIVLGTPKGDIHNIGKDIFAVLAEASGFRVHDLGVDVPSEDFVREMEKTGASILGMSCLLTTTFEAVQEVVDLLEKKGLRENAFIVIGGGATHQNLVSKFKVDAQTRDAFSGLKILRSRLK